MKSKAMVTRWYRNRVVVVAVCATAAAAYACVSLYSDPSTGSKTYLRRPYVDAGRPADLQSMPNQPKPRTVSLDMEYLLNCNDACGPAQRCFLGRCYCLAGRSGAPKCQERRPPPGNIIDTRHCPQDIGDTPAAISESPHAPYPDLDSCHIKHYKSDNNCAVFCYWQEDAGVVQIPRQVWENVSDEEFGIWRAAQKKEPGDRNKEHAEGFSAFEALPTNLGKYLEVGSGPYTQTRNIIRTTTSAGRPVHMDKIYLAEPNIFRYVTLDNCAYKDGHLEGRPVNLLSLPVEDLPAAEFFDTVVSINVIEHVHDAMQFLTSIYNAVKPGGLLVFCDRYFDDPDKDAEVLGPAMIHPIRVKREFLQHFFRLFDVVYLSDHNTGSARGRAMGEKGYYFIGRKKTVFTQRSEMPLTELNALFPANPFTKISQKSLAQ